MFVNIDPKAINDLKRKAKAIEEEASVYDIGFDAPPRKKINSPTKQVFAVPTGKTRFRRCSAFVETSQSNDYEIDKETQQEKYQSHSGSMCNFALNDKHTSTLQSTTQFRQCNPIDLIVISSTQTKNSLVESVISDPTSIHLNAAINDDLSVIQTLSSNENENAIEPLLFRNGYFKVINQQDTFVDAMCVICGFDENNKPKKILKAQKNASSNLISHFKVN